MSSQSIYSKKIRDFRKSNYLCMFCGKKLPKSRRDKYVRCSKCTVELNEYARNRIKKFIDAGLCVSCGKFPVDKSISKRLCVKCFKRKNKWKKDNIEYILFYTARGRAKRRNLEFNLDKSDVIVPEYCPLLGIKLDLGTNKSHDFSPSLDRIDNTKGYVKGNVWVISYRANRIKGDTTLEEMEKLYKNWRKTIMFP